MYVYVCICMYMYVYVCICMYVYVYVCKCMYMYVYVCICICICMCMYVCMSVCKLSIHLSTWYCGMFGKHQLEAKHWSTDKHHHVSPDGPGASTACSKRSNPVAPPRSPGTTETMETPMSVAKIWGFKLEIPMQPFCFGRFRCFCFLLGRQDRSCHHFANSANQLKSHFRGVGTESGEFNPA